MFPNEEFSVRRNPSNSPNLYVGMARFLEGQDSSCGLEKTCCEVVDFLRMIASPPLFGVAYLADARHSPQTINRINPRTLPGPSSNHITSLSKPQDRTFWELKCIRRFVNLVTCGQDSLSLLARWLESSTPTRVCWFNSYDNQKLLLNICSC